MALTPKLLDNHYNKQMKKNNTIYQKSYYT